MFDLFLTEAYAPFTVSLALLFGLLGLELAVALLGGTLLGLGADSEFDTGLDTFDIADVDLDVDASDLVDVDLTVAGETAGAGSGGVAPVGPAYWLGFGKVPLLIWIAAVLLGFGLSGVLLQQGSFTVFGNTLPKLLAVPIAAVVGVWFARQFSGAFARLLPKTETSALSKRHLGRRTGKVTQGNARRGTPAEVRITDRYGNIHYLRGEPLRDDETIAQGTDVLVLRHRRDQGYRLIALPEDT